MSRLQQHDVPNDSVLAPRFRALALGLVTLVAAAAFSRLGVSTALPAAAEELGGLGLYGWVFTAFTLANIVGLAVAGPVFDRFGILRPLAVGTASFAVGLLVSSLAPEMWVVVAGRIFQGLGAGALSVATYSAIGRGFPDEIRPKMLALNASAFTVPSLIGPVLAGLVAENFTWRWVFAVLVPLAPLAVLLVKAPLARIDQDADAHRKGDASTGAVPHTMVLARRLAGGLALAAGLGTTLAAPSLSVMWATVAVVVGLPIAYLGAQEILPAGTLLARRGLPANVVFAAMLSMAFFTADLFIPLALTSAADVSAAVAGTVVTAGIIGWTGGAYLPDRLIKRGVATRAIARLGAALVIAGLVVLGGVVLADLSILVAVGGWILAGLGAGLAFTTNSIAVLDDPAGGVGSASSQMELGNQLGVAIGTAVAGALVGTAGASTGGLTAVFAVASASALLALVVPSRFATGQE